MLEHRKIVVFEGKCRRFRFLANVQKFVQCIRMLYLGCFILVVGSVTESFLVSDNITAPCLRLKHLNFKKCYIFALLLEPIQYKN